MKKTLLLFITVLTATFAGAQDFTVGDIGYTITASIAGGDATDEVAVQGSTLATPLVPSMVDDGSVTYTVTSIGTNAFLNSTTITSIELPETVIAVGDSAFKTAVNLEEVTFTNSNSITTIGAAAFQNCNSLTSITDIISSVVNFTGNGIFNFNSNNTSITSLITPSTLTDFNVTSTFRSTSIVTADLTASTLLTSIGALTFFNNLSLTSVKLPSNLSALGNNAFLTCTALTAIEVNNPVPAAINVLNTFSGVPNTAILYVPDAAAKTAYEADANWLAIFDASRIVVGSITLSTSSENIEQELGFSIYPNPANDSVSISSKQLNNANVTVFDLNGRALLSNTLNGTSSKINISSLASGIYLFKVQAENGEFTKRIVKQ